MIIPWSNLILSSKYLINFIHFEAGFELSFKIVEKKIKNF
jgi:hypothetical protein